MSTESPAEGRTAISPWKRILCAFLAHCEHERVQAERDDLFRRVEQVERDLAYEKRFRARNVFLRNQQ